MNRRGFLKKMGLGAVAVVATPIAVLAAKQPQALHYANDDWDFQDPFNRHINERIDEIDWDKMRAGEKTPVEQYMTDALSKNLRERMDEICFEQMYSGTGITFS